MASQNNTPICHLCGVTDSRAIFLGRDRLHRTDDRLFQIYRCAKCGLVFLYPQPTEEELEKYYPQTYGPYHTDSAILKYGGLAQVFKKARSTVIPKENEIPIDTSKARILDFGCGGGAYLERMRKLHPRWDFFGFDTSEYACVSAQEKGFTVIAGKAEITLDKFKGQFDYIHLGHVIEHLPDPKSTLTFLRTLLKPGGEMHMTTPNVDSFAARIFKSYWFALDTPRHLFLFSPITISRLLRDTGFVTKSIQCTRDMGVEIRSVNYLFERADMRMPFFIWHLARVVLAPVGLVLAILKKSSIMNITAVIN